jgi:hypothetical protein
MRMQTKEARLAMRTIFMPKGALKVVPKGLNVTFYLSNRDIPGLSHPFRAQCFIGTASKPAWDYTYRTEQARDKAIADQIARSKEIKSYKEARKPAATPRNVKVGDIFYASWGYSMTLVSYYQVVELIGAQSVRVREIQKTHVSGDGWQCHVRPVKDSFYSNSDEFTVRVTGTSAKIDGHFAQLDDGKPHYENHAD